MKTPDYMSYNKYNKQKKKNNSQKGLVIFLTTFFATLLVFTAVAKNLTPNVDVSIGEDTTMEAKDTGLGVKKFIDSRLKMIQMEDNSAGVSRKIEEKTPSYLNQNDEQYSEASEEKIKLPSSRKKPDSYGDNYVEEPLDFAPIPLAQPSTKTSNPFETPKMSKVIVGHYSNIEQAKVAQGILIDSQLNLTPFIKNMGSYYTLQVGSYSSRAKAESLVSELLRNNFPAKVIQE